MACQASLAWAWADGSNEAALSPAISENPSFNDQSSSDSAPKLDLTLTEIELEAIIRRYQVRTGFAEEGLLEEVTVQAPPVTLKMRDLTQEIWGGIAAPFWALLHPAQSWRIFLPIPPKQSDPANSGQDR